jgi:hypothetical protein
MNTLFWNVTPCSLVEIYKDLKKFCSILKVENCLLVETASWRKLLTGGNYLLVEAAELFFLP